MKPVLVTWAELGGANGLLEGFLKLPILIQPDIRIAFIFLFLAGLLSSHVGVELCGCALLVFEVCWQVPEQCRRDQCLLMHALQLGQQQQPWWSL